jgi:peptide/nickel transport system permease protein
MSEAIVMNGSAPNVYFKKKSQMAEIWRRFKKNKLAMFGLAVILLMVLTAVFADVIVPYDKAVTMNVKEKLHKPSAEFWFGTDGYGRDTFARCVHGTRISLIIGFGATFAATIVGASLGLICGYYGGKLDNLYGVFLDIFAALPPVLWALCIVRGLGNSATTSLSARCCQNPVFVRIVRSSTLTPPRRRICRGGRSRRTLDSRIMFRHNSAQYTGAADRARGAEYFQHDPYGSLLSIFGLGVVAPMPEWGALISEAKEFMRTSAYLMIFPGLLIIFASLAMNLLGDGIRDAMDPKLKS